MKKYLGIMYVKFALLALGMGAGQAQSAVTVNADGTALVQLGVNMSYRTVSMKNYVSGATENITMWTFSDSSNSSTSNNGSYGGSQDSTAPFPGPVLVVRQNDTVEYKFNDTCPCENRPSDHPYAGHTIHLHGLDVNTKNDGVSDTSFSVLPWQSYAYKMKAPENGSFVYHCHIHTVLHQNMGMYGGIIVMPPAEADQNKPFTGGPVFTKQYYWVTAEVDKSWHDKAAQSNYGDSSEFSYFSQYNPQHFLLAHYVIDLTKLTGGRGQIVNTTATPIALKNETVLIRVGNLGYLNHRVTFGGLKFDAVATDGKPMRDANGVLLPMTDLTSLEYAAGERYDLMLKLPSTAGTVTGKIEYLNPHQKTVVGVVTKAITVQ